MKTLYAACLSRLGLSLAAAAELHGVGLQTVKHWSSGRRPVPSGVWADLRKRENLIIDRSETIREAWEDAGEIREIEAAWIDDPGLLGLADFVLTEDVTPD